MGHLYYNGQKKMAGQSNVIQMAIKISGSRCETYDFFSEHARCPIVRLKLYSKAQLAKARLLTQKVPPPPLRNFAHLQLSCCPLLPPPDPPAPRKPSFSADRTSFPPISFSFRRKWFYVLT